MSQYTGNKKGPSTKEGKPPRLFYSGFTWRIGGMLGLLSSTIDIRVSSFTIRFPRKYKKELDHRKLKLTVKMNKSPVLSATDAFENTAYLFYR